MISIFVAAVGGVGLCVGMALLLDMLANGAFRIPNTHPAPSRPVVPES